MDMTRRTDNSYVRARMNKTHSTKEARDTARAKLDAMAIVKRASESVTTPAPAENDVTKKTGMPLTGNVLQLVNDQYMKEAWSSEIYYQMSAYFADIKLEGFSKYFRKQAAEEREHAMKFFDYLIQCNILVKPVPFPAAPTAYKTPREACKFFLEHEHEVTRLIQAIADACMNAKDYYTFEFIQWFLKEQLNEVRQAEDLSKKMALVADDRAGLLILDGQLGA